MKKPSPKTGIRAWESELKKLNVTIRKAQRQGIFIEETTIARPKRATKKQVAKLTAIREQIKQRIKAIDEEPTKQREQRTEAIETHTRKGGAGVEERSARTRYANPKEDTRLTPEQRAEVRREAARKAAQTRKKHEAEMPAEQRENLRKQRAERFLKAIAKTRKEAAKKAAETRRKKEEAMPPEEREALRKKRAEQFEKNIGRKKDEKDLAPLTDEVVTRDSNSYASEAEIAYYRITKWINDVNRLTRVTRNEFQGVNADKLGYMLSNTIAKYGFNEVMRRIAKDVDRFEVNAEIILFSSDVTEVEIALHDMANIIMNGAMTADEAKEIEEYYEALPSDEDLIPLELLEEPHEF